MTPDALLPLIEELDALEKKATPRPWRAVDHLLFLPLYNKDYPEGQMRLCHSLTFEHKGIEEPNVALIAALRNAWPRIREALRAPAPGWVACSERLPDEQEHVLIFLGNGHYRPVREGYISRFAYNEQTKKDFDLPIWVDATEQVGDEGSPRYHSEVTHWMPLPAAPTE